MDAKTIVTKFYRNFTVSERRVLNRCGVFNHTIAEVINQLKESPLTVNLPPEATDLLVQKIINT